MARLSKQRRAASTTQRARTARATSCGGIVLRTTDDGLEICLGKLRRERDDSSSWTLPKGTPSDGETVEQTALREVEEETGLDVRINAPVGAIEYFFTQSGTRIHKTVHFFLMEAVGGSLDQHDREFDEVRWMSIEEARRLLSYPTERQVMEEALSVAGIDA
ncbi:MAG: NUDIX hydrolase [Candidatus Limnocylindrales bacterium]